MKKILVVDDDAMNLKMACFILDQKSYPVITAMSGQECMVFFAHSTYRYFLTNNYGERKNHVFEVIYYAEIENIVIKTGYQTQTISNKKIRKYAYNNYTNSTIFQIVSIFY